MHWKSDIKGQIKSNKTRMAELLSSQNQLLVKEQEEREKEAAKTLKREHRSVTANLSQGIESWSNTIVQKCDPSKLENFDDFRIWECSKWLTGIDTELREGLSKFTESSKIWSVQYDESDLLVVKTNKVKDNALKTRNSYAMT